jgi:hypothetical protein
MNRSQLLAGAVALVIALSFGCTRGAHSPTDPSGPDFLSLSSITPPTGTKLSPGSSVTFTVKVDYQETCKDNLNVLSGGTITMVIQDQVDTNLLSPGVSKAVDNGRGSATLSAHISVPTAGVNQVKVLLRLDPEAIGCILQFRSYSVSASYPVGH